MICKIAYLVVMGLIVMVTVAVAGSSEKERAAAVSAEKWLAMAGIRLLY
jgi:hypothetical protein